MHTINRCLRNDVINFFLGKKPVNSTLKSNKFITVVLNHNNYGFGTIIADYYYKQSVCKFKLSQVLTQAQSFLVRRKR